MWQEFKEFALKGNVLDLAVGVIIGAAFGKIVTSLVENIIMPIVTLLIGKVDVSDLAYKSIKYGAFIQSVIDFVIIAFSIFLFIKIVMSLGNKMKLLKKKQQLKHKKMYLKIFVNYYVNKTNINKFVSIRKTGIALWCGSGFSL